MEQEPAEKCGIIKKTALLDGLLLYCFSKGTTAQSGAVQ